MTRKRDMSRPERGENQGREGEGKGMHTA